MPIRMVVLLSLAPLARAQPTAPVDLADPPQGLFVDDWYAVQLLGKKAGHMHATSRREGDTIHSRVDTVLTIVRDQATVRIETVDISRETIDGRPLGFETLMNTGRHTVRFSGTMSDGRIQLTIEQLGNRIERSFACDPRTRLAWGEWLDQLRHGTTPGTRYTSYVYNPGLKPDAPIPIEVEVIGPETIDLFGRKTEAVALVQTLLGVKTRIWIGPDGKHLRLRSEVMSMPIEMTLCSKAYALADVEPPEMFISSLIRTDARIDRHKARKITYRLRLTGEGASLPDLPETGMQHVITRDKQTVTLVVTRQDHAALAKAKRTATAPDLTKYVEPSLFLNYDDPRLRDMAEAAAPDRAQPYQLADALCRYVARIITNKNLNVGFATASEVARSREGDCSEHAVLLAALARANGLPARAVSGVIYVEGVGGKDPVFGYHMWTQVHLGGVWVDLDAAQQQTDCDPTHIALAILPMNDAGLADAALSLLTVIGRLNIDVLKVE